MPSLVHHQANRQRILDLIQHKGVVSRDDAINISEATLLFLLKSGKIERIEHGFYRLTGSTATPSTPRQRVLDLIKQKGVIRSGDVRATGINTTLLTKLVKLGKVEHIRFGYYRLAGSIATRPSKPQLILDLIRQKGVVSVSDVPFMEAF